MKEKTDKLLTLVLLGLAIIVTVFAVLFAMQDKVDMPQSPLFDVAFWLMVVLIAVSIIAILIFLVKKLAARFKEEPGYLKKFLLLCAIIIVVVVVSYLLAKGTDVDLQKYQITEGTSKLIGAACIICYILTIGAAIAIAVTEIMPKSNKKK